jgi:hypothetical protein
MEPKTHVAREAELRAIFARPDGSERLREHLRKLMNIPEGNALALVGMPIIQKIIELEFGG